MAHPNKLCMNSLMINLPGSDPKVIENICSNNGAICMGNNNYISVQCFHLHYMLPVCSMEMLMKQVNLHNFHIPPFL